MAVAWWSGGISRWFEYKAVQEIQARNLDAAEYYIRASLKFNSDSAESYFLLARLQRKRGELKQFGKTLKKAVALGLENQRAMNESLLAQAQAGAIQSIRSQLDKMLISGTDDGREVLEAYVNGCLASAYMQQAEALIEGWIQTYPQDAQAYYFKGRVLMYYNNLDLARKEFQKTLERKSDHYGAWYLLGQIQMQQNRPEEALNSFQECRGMEYNAAPEIAEAKALRSLGRVDDAREILEKTAAYSNDHVRRSFQILGERFEGAPVALELGSLELAAQRYEEAVHWLNQAVDANPRDLSALHARGLALRGAGRLEEARRDLDAVREARTQLREVDHLADQIQQDPSLIDERVRIGELYLKYESKLTAEFWLKSALTKNPQHPLAHRLLAQLYRERSAKDLEYESLAEYHEQQAEQYSAPQITIP